MKVETELKFEVKDFHLILQKLEHHNGKYTPWYFEKNIVLDDQQGSLKKKDVLLRLRTGLDNRITLKTPLPGNESKTVKARNEYETQVMDLREMESILNLLGYKLWLSYEKFRQKWIIGKVKICLDILPFGKYVEIEGEQEQLLDTATFLDLDVFRSTDKTYHDLNQEHIRKNNLKPSNDFVFDAHSKKQLFNELGIEEKQICKES